MLPWPLNLIYKGWRENRDQHITGLVQHRGRVCISPPLTLTATDILCTSKLFHLNTTSKALAASQRGEWRCWQEVMQADRKADGFLVWLWSRRRTGIQARGVKRLLQPAANTRSTSRFSLGSVCWPHRNNKFFGIKTLGNVLAKSLASEKYMIDTNTKQINTKQIKMKVHMPGWWPKQI